MVEQTSVRDVIREVIHAYEAHGGAIEREAATAVETHRQLLQRPDLLDLGVRRDGNHVARSTYLYYDPELAITCTSHEVGAIPVHNHGTFELVGVYRGEILYTQYKRLDDRSVPGRAELEVVDERPLTAGEVVLCPSPPHDIHGFSVVREGTFTSSVTGRFTHLREYYDPASQTYVSRDQKLWKQGEPGAPLRWYEQVS